MLRIPVNGVFCMFCASRPNSFSSREIIIERERLSCFSCQLYILRFTFAPHPLRERWASRGVVEMHVVGTIILKSRCSQTHRQHHSLIRMASQSSDFSVCFGFFFLRFPFCFPNCANGNVYLIINIIYFIQDEDFYRVRVQYLSLSRRW